MSIIPGIETAAPERTETSNGSVRIAEPLAGALLEARDRDLELVGEPVGQLAAGVHVVGARFRRHGEPGRDRNPQCRHLGQPGALPPEQLTADARRIRIVVDVPSHSLRRLTLLDPRPRSLPTVALGNLPAGPAV